VIAARSGDLEHVPGGKTGLLTRSLKMVGSGDESTLVTEYVVDVPVIREIRALHEQTAKETGQWTEKIEHSGSITREFVIVPDPAVAPS
jgi:hypothetical protein